jgi:signal recognition particle receptor subunit beta
MRQLELGKAAPTHTSVLPHTVETALPAGRVPRSQAHRSPHDAAALARRKLLLADTPGHGKLRHLALDELERGKATARAVAAGGVVFVVDAAGLGAEDAGAAGGLREAAGYLHDALLLLQRQVAAGRRRRGVPVLVAANKMDLFTALPAGMVRASLEAEISRQRSTRARGIAGAASAGKKGEGLDTAADALDEGRDEGDVLAGESEGRFEFARMAEWGIEVAVVGGSAAGEEASVDGWWDWIAEHV